MEHSISVESFCIIVHALGLVSCSLVSDSYLTRLYYRIFHMGDKYDKR